MALWSVTPPPNAPSAGYLATQLLVIYRTLLHEYRDFFLASQHPHPEGSTAETSHARTHVEAWHLRLPLRHRMPHSLELMRTFIYLAFSLVTTREVSKGPLCRGPRGAGDPMKWGGEATT